jgi:Ser/Thr protein kinase RdoA (MazF antagonist)
MSLTIIEAEAICLELFGVKGVATQLPGEVDLNFLIKSKEDEKYVLKIAHSERTLDNLHLQNDILTHLEKKQFPVAIPKVILGKNGQSIIKYTKDRSTPIFIRLLTWIEGRLLAKVNPVTNGLLESLGAACGHLCTALKDFDHSGAHRFYKWDNSAANWVADQLEMVEAGEKRDLVKHFLTLFQQEVLPLFPQLRRSVNYNDANDYNVLVNNDLANPAIAGLIDFGDTVYTHTINEVAITAAYALMGKEDPLAAACEIVKGFHQVFPITEAECKVIFPLIATRLFISVTVSSINQKETPDNPYLQISARPAWELLRKLKNISPAFAHYTFRSVCGYEAHPKNKLFL